jgi:hypothetical protein
VSAALVQKTATAGFLAVILAFYIWTATSNGNVYQFDSPGYYNLLTDAFLAGRLSLLVEPRKELLALRDPYDPHQNRGLRLNDASLYRGKYYLYFGPTPALVLFIPFRVIFGTYLGQNLAVALLSLGGLGWSVLLLDFLTRIYFPSTPFWMRLTAISCLSFSNVVPFILRRPVVYEVAISAGYCFLLGSLFWLLSGGLKDGRARLWRLFLGSLFLGLAAGCRPHHVFAAALLVVLWLKCLREQYHYRVRDALKELYCLFAPLLVCVALLGLYNYARFDSWTEFGVHYQLAGVSGVNPSKEAIFDPERILPNLFFHFLAPYQMTWRSHLFTWHHDFPGHFPTASTGRGLWPAFSQPPLF